MKEMSRVQGKTKSEFQTTLDGRRTQEDWDFARADTSYDTHGLHDYPARMIPQIAERLILRYSDFGQQILDPFCGSGTTVIEARLAARNSIGSDINPLAILLAKVKSTPLDFEKMGFDASHFMNEIETKYNHAKNKNRLPDIPKEIMPNLNHWFKPEASGVLEFLYQEIKQLDDEELKDFLLIVFSNTVFRSSNIDHRSSRFIRVLHEKELKQFKPDVIGNFRRKLIDSVNRMAVFNRKVTDVNKLHNIKSKAVVKHCDARELPYRENEIDCIITSPPYGEEKNTVGYARWSKLSVAWLRLNGEALSKSEKESLGFKPSKNVKDDLEKLESPTTVKLLKNVFREDQQRVKDALPFFFDYSKTLAEMFRVLKPNATCSIVVGDRSIRKRPLDMEKVTVELATSVGFKHETSYFRQIPMKLIPWDTPTGKTIARESIIILKKL